MNIKPWTVQNVRRARQVENDAQYGSRYYELYRAEAPNGILNANLVNLDVLGEERQ